MSLLGNIRSLMTRPYKYNSGLQEVLSDPYTVIPFSFIPKHPYWLERRRVFCRLASIRSRR